MSAKTAQKLGQHFLHNRNVLQRIAQEAVPAGCGCVLEIGPGSGSLTEELIPRCDMLVCIELDGALITGLRARFDSIERVKIIHGDVLKTDLSALARNCFDGQSFFVAANIPYYITTPIIMKLLRCGVCMEKISLVVQREAAQRYCTQPGEHGCCAASVTAAYYAKPERVFDISANAFNPPPKVDSSLLILKPFNNYDNPPCNELLLMKIIESGFSSRRKTLANNLSVMLNIEKARICSVLCDMELDESIRAEKLTIDNFISLTNALYYECSSLQTNKLQDYKETP